MSERSIRRVGSTTALVAAGLVAGGVLAGSLTASAATPSPSTPSSSAAAPSSDAAVTGSEADNVKAAVTAKFSTVTISTVRQDADGSYDALGTDASGNHVFYDVSADLRTITAGGGHGPGRGRGPGGGPDGGSRDAAVTGAAADNVKAAVKAKFSTVTITTVRKDPDGSYDALGTDASGNRVCYDVSADLKTITAGGGHGEGHGDGHGPMAPGSATSSATPSA